MRFKALISCAAAAPLLVAAMQPVRLAPSSNWDVDYAENSCRLIRTFGTRDAQVKLEFESESPDTMDMLAVGKPLQFNGQEVVAKFLPALGIPMTGSTATSAVGPAILWSWANALPRDYADKLQKMAKAQRLRPNDRPAPIVLAQQAEARAIREQFLAQTNALEIDVNRGRPLVLETGSLKAAMAAFDKCSRDSMHDWGVNPEPEDKIVRPPWPIDVRSWFSSDDYPASMFVKGEQSDVKVRVLVDATGRVTRCTSLSHFTEKSFNQVVCDAITKRAHFAPAETADGTKVPSYYIKQVSFRMPD